MFDIDQAILKWRRQMVDGGITATSTLDELESHLREDVETNVRSGQNVQQAFEGAVERLGQASLLRCEFEKDEKAKQVPRHNHLLRIRVLAIALIAFYGLGALWAVVAFFSTGMSPPLFKALASSLVFVAGGIGLLKLKRWGWWLTIGLCAIIIIQSLWSILGLTSETATKQHGITPYVVAGFYLAVTFLLASDSVRKVLRETHG